MIFFGRHKSEQKKKEIDPLTMVREGREYAIACKYNMEELHCNGCPNSCAVANVKCTKGRLLKSEIQKLYNS